MTLWQARFQYIYNMLKDGRQLYYCSSIMLCCSDTSLYCSHQTEFLLDHWVRQRYYTYYLRFISFICSNQSSTFLLDCFHSIIACKPEAYKGNDNSYHFPLLNTPSSSVEYIPTLILFAQNTDAFPGIARTNLPLSIPMCSSVLKIIYCTMMKMTKICSSQNQ